MGVLCRVVFVAVFWCGWQTRPGLASSSLHYSKLCDLLPPSPSLPPSLSNARTLHTHTYNTQPSPRQKMDRDCNDDDLDGQLNPFNDGPLPPSLPLPPLEEQQRALNNAGYRDGAAAGHALGLQEGFDEGFGKGIEAGEALGRLLGVAR